MPEAPLGRGYLRKASRCRRTAALKGDIEQPFMPSMRNTSRLHRYCRRLRCRVVAARTRPLCYAAVGGFATGVHYALLVLAVEVFDAPAWLGSGLGALVGAQVAYAGNRRYTFAHAGTIARSWPRFMATATLGALLGMGVVGLGVSIGVPYLAAQGVATLLGLVATFLINRAWTFR